MSKRKLLFASLTSLTAIIFSFTLAFAHESVTAGDYEIEYGWVNEPAIVNQLNGIVINITKSDAISMSEMPGSVMFMHPTNGADVQGAETEVAVMIDGLDAHAADSGIHWHLYMDDQLLSMIPVDQTSVKVTGLTNGSHMFKVILSNENHMDFGDPATTMINVSGAADTGMAMVEGAAEMTMETTTHDHSTMTEDVDVSGLVVEVSYGGQNKQLTLQPLGEDIPGQFIAPILPTVPGQYTIKLSGKIDGTDISPIEVEPEEVQGADVLAFPSIAAAGTTGTSNWFAIAGLIFGLGGLVLGFMAYRKTN